MGISSGWVSDMGHEGTWDLGYHRIFWDTGFCLRFAGLFNLRLQFLQIIFEAPKPEEGD